MQQTFVKIQSLLDTYQIPTKNVSGRLICMLCQKILRNSVQTSCGCKACKYCMEIYLKEGPKPCPSDTQECRDVILDIKKDIFQDNASNKDVSNLTVNCPFSPCVISEKLMKMVCHIEECEFRQIACDKCSMKITVKDKVVHEETICEMRHVTCPHCSQISTQKNLIEDHLNVESDEFCPKMTGKCPNKCDVLDTVNLKDHLSTCKNKKTECPFHYLGCRINKMSENDLMKHISDDSITHMKYLLTKLESQEQKLNLSINQSAQQQKIINQLHTIEKLDETVNKQKKEIKELQEQIKIRNQSANSNVEKPVIFRNGIYIWKIDNFPVKKTDAEQNGPVSITSEPFYTGDFGYKMCLRIYPAGDGTGKGTHLSIFFALMKGDYDDLLSWPFKQKVTLSLLDVANHSKDISDTFRPDVRSPCYSKPTDECNIASGAPRFVVQEKLWSDSVYCVDDTIYVKISVDTVAVNR